MEPAPQCVQSCVVQMANARENAAFRVQEAEQEPHDLREFVKSRTATTCEELKQREGRESPVNIYRFGIEKIRVYQKACRCANETGRDSGRVTDRYSPLRAFGKPDWAAGVDSVGWFQSRRSKRASSPTFYRASALGELLQGYEYTVAGAQYESKTKTLIALLYTGQVIPGSLACLLEREWGDLKIELRRTCHAREVYERVRWVLSNGEWLKERKKGQLLIGIDPFSQGVFDIEMYKGNAPAVPVLKRELGCLFDELIEVNLRSIPRWLGH